MPLSCGSGNDNKKTDQTHNKEDDTNHNASNLTGWMIVGRVIYTYGKGNNAQDNRSIVRCTISHDNNLLKKLYFGETTSPLLILIHTSTLQTSTCYGLPLLLY